MNRKLGPLAALAVIALIGAGCGSNGPSETGVARNTGAASADGRTDSHYPDVPIGRGCRKKQG
jgi:hypothetical protein